MRAPARAALISLVLGSSLSCAPPRAAVNEPLGRRSDSSSREADGGGPLSFPSLETLAAEGPRVAPGLHEAQRRDLGGASEFPPNQPIELLAAVKADACARVLVATEGPLRVKLDTSRGASLADRTVDGTEPFGPRGPLCLRRGEALLLRVDPAPGPDGGVTDGGAAHVRVLVWSGS